MSVRDITISDLRRRIVPRRLPASEQYRTYYGRSLDMARIEYAIRQAEFGFMVPITDLESETLSLDGHVQALAVKRFGAIQSVPWGLTPAKGPGIDPALAEECHDIVHAQLTQIPCFGERLYDLAWAEYDGRGALEIQWDQRPGNVPWWVEGLDWIHPRRLSFDQRRDLRLIDTWRSVGNFIEQGFRLADAPAKFIWWMPRLFREYPEREGLAPRSLYWCFFKRFSWRHRMILIELFAVPWRIGKASETASPEGIEDAEAALERLGQDTTAMLEQGIEVDVVEPGEKSGELVSMTSGDVDKEMSKLWLGNTGTTETDQTNRSNGIIGKGEQEIILDRLGEGLSGRVQHQLVRPIVQLNRGDDALSHAPTFELQTDPPRDRDKDMGLIERAVKLQVPVAIDEIRETSGTREPDDKEAYVVGALDATGNVTYQVVDPKAPAAPTIDDAAKKAPAQEDAGVAGAKDRAEQDASMVAAIVRRTGLDEAAATRAYEAASSGAYAELNRIGGLGSDDALWIVETVPRLFRIDAGELLLPIGPYEDFEACVIDQKAKGHNDESARKICGALQNKIEGERALEGVRELANLRGLELTDNALRALAAMPPDTRAAVVESLLTGEHDRHRPLDP